MGGDLHNPLLGREPDIDEITDCKVFAREALKREQEALELGRSGYLHLSRSVLAWRRHASLRWPPHHSRTRCESLRENMVIVASLSGSWSSSSNPRGFVLFVQCSYGAICKSCFNV
ncbi:hypothetical protein Syun_009203 [Stephania yunnanensis]|uniref:Uncharacterized protein n=1 Tax=Stephania yunnanensis TaxID=152371 RepID=A0AAP0PQF2_9MAGN